MYPKFNKFFCFIALTLLACLPCSALADNKPEGFAMPDSEKFIAEWKQSSGYEMASSQPFLTAFCDFLNLPRPESPRPQLADNGYSFEHPVKLISPNGSVSSGRIDLYKQGCFIWESKQGSPKQVGETGPRRTGTAIRETPGWDKAMLAAKSQGENYARNLPPAEGKPPFLLISDIGYSIEIYADFRGTGFYTPFPNARENRINLDDLRKQRQQQYPKLTLSDMYATLEKLNSDETFTAKDIEISEQADIPALKALHDQLDAAVLEAYGWPADLSNEEVLERLFLLNQERAAEEKAGQIRWLRSEYQNPASDSQSYQDSLLHLIEGMRELSAPQKPEQNEEACWQTMHFYHRNSTFSGQDLLS